MNPTVSPPMIAIAVGVLAFAAFLLGLAGIGLAMWRLLHLSATDGRSFYCNGCGDKWFYTTASRPVLEMRGAGWLCLPGRVHYCPECRDGVDAEIERDRIRQLKAIDFGNHSRDILTRGFEISAAGKLNPYSPPAEDAEQ